MWSSQKEILEFPRPINIRDYAMAKGWIPLDRSPKGLMVLKSPTEELTQLLIPKSADVKDYADFVEAIVARLADFEQRSPTAILADLMHPFSDTVRFRIFTDSNTIGSIPLADGLSLLEGAKKSLASAACSVIQRQSRPHC
jgi:hypothetical protein